MLNAVGSSLAGRFGPQMLAQNNCGYGSAALVSDNAQGAPYTIACTTTESSNSETVTWSVEGTFIQSGYNSSIYWGPNNNAVTGHGTCMVVSGAQVNCNAKMTYDFLQTNSPTANSQFDNIAQDEINALPPSSACVVGVARVVTSYIPGAACKTTGGGGGGGNCGNGGCGGQSGGGCGSPIIIDAYGEGFHMTDVADGVLFDLRGDGHPIDMGWTARGYHNAFLALDRNGNGKIDIGEELFGNYTPQPKSKDANGYAALAEFDKPENGGNGDGVINEKDAIYSKLLLWIDENHDGISQPNELHPLSELGVFSLSLKYVDTPHRDAFGNWFRYKGKINPLGEPQADPVDRISYDVFFELQAPGPRPPACE